MDFSNNKYITEFKNVILKNYKMTSVYNTFA